MLPACQAGQSGLPRRPYSSSPTPLKLLRRLVKCFVSLWWRCIFLKYLIVRFILFQKNRIRRPCSLWKKLQNKLTRASSMRDVLFFSSVYVCSCVRTQHDCCIFCQGQCGSSILPRPLQHYCSAMSSSPIGKSPIGLVYLISSPDEMQNYLNPLDNDPMSRF